MRERIIKSIITLGPSTSTKKCLEIIKDKGVDFARVNMSHSSIEDLEYFLRLSKSVGIPFMLDTEGSQIRTGTLENDIHHYKEHRKVKIFADQIIGNNEKLCLKPGAVVMALQEGDLLHIDFDTLILQIFDTSTINQGYVIAKVVTNGSLGKDKAVVIDPRFDNSFGLPALTNKDLEAIRLGLKMGVEYIAVSFVRSGKAVDEAREATENKMKIISKIECIEALQRLDDITRKSDFLLLDRGDLSKEISISRIPFTQKLIINKAKDYDKGVFIATNLLESMIEKRKPTRAEVHDVITSIMDGADGLVLSAETAIGRYPMESINMLHKLINHVECVVDIQEIKKERFKYINQLEASGYLMNTDGSSLVTPHGGVLINRLLAEPPDDEYLASLPKIKVDITKQMEVEQIATGAYSPLEGFMNEDDFNSVLDKMRLSNGLVWPLPIVLGVTIKEADRIKRGDKVSLVSNKDEIFAILHLDNKYSFDKEKTAERIYGTKSTEHPGVQMINDMNPVLLSGKVDLIRWRKSPIMAYELTPKQVRKLFEENGWVKIAGFHTRNIPHKGHEFIQLKALEDEYCDGVFIHPVVGKKKKGDFNPVFVMSSYEKLIENLHLSKKVVLAAFSTYSRYAGPREAILTALCRKNYGCSHFIVGRDHTGVGDFYHPQASQNIFDDFPDLGIKIIKVDEVVYSKKLKKYFFNKDYPRNEANNKVSISGTLVRRKLLAGITPSSWLIRPEISKFILESIKNKEEVILCS